MIHGDRVRQAREFRGLTQTELAERVDVRQPTIALIESGLRQPSDGVLSLIALQTGFPPAYFRQGPPPQFPLGSLLFRAQVSTSARQRTQAQRWGEIVYELITTMESRVVTTNPLRLPRLDAGTPPEEGAQLTRAAFGLAPDRPVPHLTNRIERSGVVVLALPTALPKRDAFSVWTDTMPVTPLIAIASGVPGDRVRFSVAHELGHLVLHSSLKGGVAVVEKEADRFAAEFLMPEAGIRDDLAEPVTLSSLAELKPRWGVAIQALAVRAKDLGVITDGQASYLFRQISARGWRKREPIELVPEKPRALRKMAEILYGIPIDIRRLAADAALPPTLVGEILDAHASLADQPRRQPEEIEPSNLVNFRLRGEPATGA
jgi:Zn-dependent peptidase ImmA (M78 family)/transcriptional regulator with XRE-family HTH domain